MNSHKLERPVTLEKLLCSCNKEREEKADFESPRVAAVEG